MVFEHVGADTFNGSLLSLKRGGRLVTCGSTSGPSTTINLMQLFQQQYRIFGSFGASMRNIAESLDKMADGMLPVIEHRSPDRRCCGGAEAHGKPAGVRQNHRWFLMHPLLRRTKARIRDGAKPLGEAAVSAATIGMLRTTRFFDPIKTANMFGRITRLIGRRCASNGSGAPI